MTSTPKVPTTDPTVQPDELPDGSPSRPQGDPVMPDTDNDPGSHAETQPESNAEPGQMPESTRLDVGA